MKNLIKLHIYVRILAIQRSTKLSNLKENLRHFFWHYSPTESPMKSVECEVCLLFLSSCLCQTLLSQIVHNMTFDMIPRSSSLLNINLTLSAVQWPLHHVTTWHRLHIIISLLGKVSIKEKFIGWERNVKFSIQKLSTKGGVWVIKDPWKFQNFFFRLPWTHQNPYSCL